MFWGRVSRSLFIQTNRIVLSGNGFVNRTATKKNSLEQHPRRR